MLIQPQKKIGTCESCAATGEIHILKNLSLCKSCFDRECAIIDQNGIRELESKMSMYRDWKKSIEIDSTIQIRTDIFNANIISIAELKEQIEQDPEVTNKHFKLAEVLQERYTHLKQVVFGLRESASTIENQQRAIQSYLNDLATKLRADEREKLKLQSIDYKPAEPKLTKPKAPKITKVDKAELRQACAELSTELGMIVSESTLQLLCVAKKMTLKEAIIHMRRTTKEVESEMREEGN